MLMIKSSLIGYNIKSSIKERKDGWVSSRILNVFPREQRKNAKQLRRKGFIPAIFYGNNQTPRQLTAAKSEVNSLIRQFGESAFFEVSMEEDLKTVIIKEVQRDPVTREVIHIDLQYLPFDRRINMSIPVKFEGIKELESKGRILQRQAETVNVEGYAGALPSHIDVYVGDMQPGDTIRIHNLKVKDGVNVLGPRDKIIAVVLAASE
jgi:large subunit ribosomal protein L25